MRAPAVPVSFLVLNAETSTRVMPLPCHHPLPAGRRDSEADGCLAPGRQPQSCPASDAQRWRSPKLLLHETPDHSSLNNESKSLTWPHISCLMRHSGIQSCSSEKERKTRETQNASSFAVMEQLPHFFNTSARSLAPPASANVALGN